MTRDPFEIRAHVAGFDACQRAYEEASARTFAQHRHQANLAYGGSESERLDVFYPPTPAPGAPVHMFVHGGYWRAGSRKSYAYLADSVLDAGGIAVIADYGLMPETRMPDIVAQVRRAARWIRDHAADLGADARRFTASGHSAGAHLVSYLAARAPHEDRGPEPTVNGLLMVSGIYDLAPIPGSFLQPEIRLTAEEVRDWSPLDAEPDGEVTRVLVVGADETPPFHDQQAGFAGVLPPVRTECHTLPGLDHMSVVLNLGRPGTGAASLLTGLIHQEK